MSCKYSDPSRWQSPEFFNLSGQAKYLYCFLYDNCDLAGFIPVNDGLWNVLTGIPKENITSILDELGDLVDVDNGIAWLKNHLDENRNLPLNRKNNAHKSIIKIFEKRKDHTSSWKFFQSLPIQDITSTSTLHYTTEDLARTSEGPKYTKKKYLMSKSGKHIAYCSKCQTKLFFDNTRQYYHPSECCGADLIKTDVELLKFKGDLQEVDSKQVQS